MGLLRRIIGSSPPLSQLGFCLGGHGVAQVLALAFEKDSHQDRAAFHLNHKQTLYGDISQSKNIDNEWRNKSCSHFCDDETSEKHTEPECSHKGVGGSLASLSS